jgi:hypothetical protein
MSREKVAVKADRQSVGTLQQKRGLIAASQIYKARPVELWLDGLNLSPKSRVHIRTLIDAGSDEGMEANQSILCR